MPEPERAPIPVPRPTHPWFGKTIARCKVGDRIGRGATSHVFRATYLPLNKEIALKILAADRNLDAELRERFLGEAKAIARLDHENIVKVLDVVEDQKCLCILMEYVAGSTLQDLLDDEKVVAPKRALRIALQVARALDCAHEEDIVHRDIKPANVMLVKGGDGVKVVDFGLAARGAENRVGTPMFMSPEAAQGKRIDDKSDVYALGISLYQCLTGQLPFGGSSVKEILAAQVGQEARPPSAVRRELGTKYDDLLAKMLVKSKGYRPSAADVAGEIEDLLQEPHAPDAGRRKPRRRAAKRGSPTPIILSIAGVVILAVIIAVLVKGGSGPVADPGTTQPKPPEVVDPAAAARKAFDDATVWALANPDDAAGQARRWGEAERAAAGTEWAAKAAANRKAAEEVVAKKKAADEERDRERIAKEAKAAEVLRMHQEVVTLCKVFEFEGAASRAEKLGAPEGMSTILWNKKVARLRYLKEHFVLKLAERLKGSPIPATRLKATAAADDRIHGATRSGLTLQKGGTIPWSEVSPEDLLSKVVSKVFSSARPEDLLYQAVVATEAGLDAKGADLAKLAGMMDAAGTLRDRLGEMFEQK